MESSGDSVDVDTFDQIPSIRPPPSAAREKSSSSSGVRLFGFQVTEESPGDNGRESIKNGIRSTRAASSGGRGRQFECHYCFRHFPTSQALGGHQNAHKRERRHAWQAQLYPAMTAAAFHQSAAAGGYDFYGLDTFRRSRRHHLHHYSRLGFDSGIAPHQCLSGGLGPAAGPNNGGPSLWSSAAHHRTLVGGGAGMGLMHGEGGRGVLWNGNHAAVSSSSSSFTSTPSIISPFAAGEQLMPSIKEKNVSLDLHL